MRSQKIVVATPSLMAPFFEALKDNRALHAARVLALVWIAMKKSGNTLSHRHFTQGDFHCSFWH